MTHFRGSCKVTIAVLSDWVPADSEAEAANKISTAVAAEVAKRLETSEDYGGVSVGTLENWVTYVERTNKRRERSKPAGRP